MNINGIRKKEIRAALCICAALGWWGLLYPELTMTPDTYRIVDEKEEGREAEEAKEAASDSDIYWKILKADRGQIRFNSRLLTGLESIMNNWKCER